jgi:hypothetical protein
VRRDVYSEELTARKEAAPLAKHQRRDGFPKQDFSESGLCSTQAWHRYISASTP